VFVARNFSAAAQGKPLSLRRRRRRKRSET